MKVYRIFEKDNKIFGELEVDGHKSPIIDYSFFKGFINNGLVNIIMNAMKLSYDLLSFENNTLEEKAIPNLIHGAIIDDIQAFKNLGIKI